MVGYKPGISPPSYSLLLDSLLNLTVLLIEIYVYIYAHRSFGIDNINGFIDKNSLLKRLSLIIYSLLVNPLTINTPINLRNDKACQKFFYLFHFASISIGKFNISLAEKTYVISLLFLFVCRSIYR